MTFGRRTSLKCKSTLKSKGNGLKSNSRLKPNSTLSSSGKINSSSKLSSKKKVNAKSSKQKEIEALYRLRKVRMFEERSHVCTGCRSVQGIDNLTHSHLIPRSRRRDLVAEYYNITYHCIECHRTWESPKRVVLLDYVENMEIVKRLDPEYHSALLAKQKESGY